ncbi:MAG: catechol 2,3-dioxygenase [Actinobacteria bacterium]|nr:catechol 2,3-dioxygenase [Actinomycetota bacterium]
MPGLSRLEHVELGVVDLDAGLDFYMRVMGMAELGRQGGTVYLGYGFDDNYDLAIRQGRTGLRHFAVRVDDDEAVVHYAHRLKDVGVETERRNGTEPGQETAVRFALPSGATMELVSVRDRRYHQPTAPVRQVSGDCPVDIHHINLMSVDVNTDAMFLHDVLDFKLSDVKQSQAQFWIQVFSRYGPQHHDVGITMATNHHHHLHHVAWTMTDWDHMRSFIDRLARSGIALELGPSRHVTGSSLFAYFWEPGGNRFELSSQAAVLDPSSPTRYTDADLGDISAWGPLLVPPTFGRGT